MIQVLEVHPDEPCYSLKELNLQAPDYKGFRRYRVLLLVPGQRLAAGSLTVHSKYLAEYCQDMGPAETFSNDQVSIVGGVPLGLDMIEVLETVGRLTEIADSLHAGYLDPVERPQGTELIQGYFDAPDKLRRQAKRQSTFGHSGKVQRD